MRQSHLFGTTRRETPHEEESKNAVLLTRGGYIDKTSAGSYSYLPIGLRVLQKIAQIVREEMNSLPHTQEMLMTALQPKEIWQETGRWDDEGMKQVMFRLEDTSLGLGASHEENVTDIFRKLYNSYRDLPLAVYQIQTKFRNEARPKSGLLRGREFLMKDLYSFHLSEAEQDEYYEQVAAAYMKIFERCSLKAIRTTASGGVFSKARSDEFQVITAAGEDTIYLNAAGDYAWNKEVVTSEDDPALLEFSGGELHKANACEVGNIFRLGTKYSMDMGAVVNTESGDRVPVIMASYGIGVSRLMGVVAEQFGDSDGVKIVWPKNLAPFAVHLIDLTTNKEGEALYKKLIEKNINVLYDDRMGSAGEKFADADLIGAPTRLVISNRSLAAGGIEVTKEWGSGAAAEVLDPEELLKTL